MGTGAVSDSDRVEFDGRRGEELFDKGYDVDYERREWIAQRIGWSVMALLVAAAFLGLLGSSGPLAAAKITAPDRSFTVSYVRLGRHHSPSDLRIEVSPAFVENGEVALWVSSEFIAGAGVEEVSPEPDSVELAAGGLIYHFSVADDSGPLLVSFRCRHDELWRQPGRLGLTNGSKVAFEQFIFP
jgi:hypothetical protein